MGFLGREVQSVLGFLKGKTSSFFSPIFAVCVDTAMSRQDIFSSSCKSFLYPVVCVLFCWYKWALDFLLFCSIIAFFLFEYVLYSGGIFLFIFRCICRRCFVFIYLYDLFLWFCLFWACESGVSLAGRVIFSFLGAPLCGMSVRYNLFGR